MEVFMRSENPRSTAVVGAVVALGLSACSEQVQTPPPASPAYVASVPTGPDWQRLDANCQNGAVNDPLHCSLVASVKEVTDFHASYRGTHLSIYTAQDLPVLADFVAKADQACTEGYQRACLAARLIKFWEKLVEARSTAGRDKSVQTEYTLALQALGRQIMTVSPTTGQRVMSPNFDEAEPHADAALAAAKAVAGTAVEAKAQADVEKAHEDALLASEGACAADLTACQASCTADAASDRCWILAHLYGAGDPHWSTIASNPSKARELAGRSCKAGNEQGCKVETNLDKRVAAQTESLWSTVTFVGDDLTRKEHLVDVARKWGSAQPRLQRELPQVLAINQSIVKEKYCPARKAFIQAASVAEFQRRAMLHCKNEAPTGQGISGAAVTLTSECSTVYAIQCP
jgi:hypothetical protein